MTIFYVLIALLVFGVLIFIHELGHFLAAKACHVTVNEFAIGMGPKLFSFCPGAKKSKKNEKKDQSSTEDDIGQNEFMVDPRPPVAYSDEKTPDIDGEPDVEGTVPKETHTVYSLRAFPIGGFVSMEGEDSESDDPNAYSKKNVWQRIAISIAGPAMNLLLGFILMLILVANTPSFSRIIYYDHEGDQENTVYLSEQSGLMSEDEIIKIGTVPVHSMQEILYEIMHQGIEPVQVTVIRNGEEKVIENVTFPNEEEDGMVVGVPDFGLYRYRSVRFTKLISDAFWRSCSTVKMVWEQLGDLLTGRVKLDAVSGPVGVTEVITNAAKDSSLNLLFVVTIISINLGVMNLLPFPALDGGHLLLYLFEIVTRKPIPKKVEGIINFVGLAILMLFMLFITVKDITGLFR